MNLFSSQFILIILSLPFFICGELPKKLRRYKICNGAKCRSIRSFNPPSFLQEMDSFLYSRWTRFAPCTRHCTTKRYRSCKFPLICGNTVIHEEAFCYHRGTYCEYLFENNKRDFLATDDTDYLDQSDEKFQSHESESHTLSGEPHLSEYHSPPQILQSRSETDRTIGNHNSYRPSSSQYGPSFGSQNKKGEIPRTPRRYMQNFTSTTVTNDLMSQDSDETNGPFPIDDEGYAQPTCGIARLTDRNRNGIAMRILGGQESKKGRWPWQVAVLNRMQEAFCGGTLVAPRWILTAAHCVRKKLHVTIGEHHLHRKDGTEKHYKIDAAFIHPDFDHETVDNDIALLLLPEPVPTEAGLACLPVDYQQLPPSGTTCTILGWGKERHTHVFGTTVLHEGKVPLVSNAECRYTYGKYEITDNMFCAGYRGGTVDTCAGDSGGPILCSVGNRWTVFGVTSFGDGCGRKGKFGIYAKVSNYVNWIKKVMKANEYLN